MVDVSKYPLPEGTPDVVVNREQLADMLDISMPTVDAYRKAGMPVITEGGNGRSYEFQLSVCYAWLRARRADEEEQDKLRKEAKRQLQLDLGLSQDLDPVAELSSADRIKFYKGEREFMEAARLRNDLMERKHVVALFTEVLTIIRDGVGLLPDRLQREIGLTVEQVERTADACDQALEEAANRIEQELGDCDEGKT